MNPEHINEKHRSNKNNISPDSTPISSLNSPNDSINININTNTNNDEDSKLSIYIRNTVKPEIKKLK